MFLLKIGIEDILKEKNMSIKKLSELAEIEYSNLYNLIKGKTKAIKFDTMEKICKVLECSPTDIFILEDDIKK